MFAAVGLFVVLLLVLLYLAMLRFQERPREQPPRLSAHSDGSRHSVTEDRRPGRAGEEVARG